MPRAQRMSRSFTLVELMVVVAILGLLATVVSVSVIDNMVKARIKLAKTDIRSIADGVKLFRLEYHRNPRNMNELIEPPLRSGRRSPPFFDRSLIDPWDNPYLYESRAGKFEIWSLGAGGEAGGEGEEADIRWSELKRSQTRSG
jgi:general secretion pathway protein G